MPTTRWMVFDGKEYDNVIGVRGRKILPKITQNKMNFPASDGSKISDAKLENAEINVNLLVEPYFNDKNTDEALAEIAETFYTGREFKQIRFEDDPDYYWMGVLTDTKVVKESLIFAEIELTFSCDPIRYGIDTILYNDINGKMYKNKGQNTHGIIAFTLPIGRTTQLIGIHGSTAKVTLKGSDLGGSWKIDTEKREVYLNGVLSLLKIDFLNTNWLAPQNTSFCIPSGSFQFDFQPAVPGATLTYKRRCL
ncbi:MAG: phage tail family protein [Eubacterium sp.]